MDIKPEQRAPSPSDPVNLPSHYARFPIEPIRFCTENGLSFLQSNAIKYICRHDAKNGKEDLKKAIRSLVMLIKQHYNKDENWWRQDEALTKYMESL